MTDAYYYQPQDYTYFNNRPRTGLPAWAYNSEKYFQYEIDNLFMTHWQLVCHESSLRNPGDYMSFALANERAFVVRGNDGKLRAFYNICRHRSSRLVNEKQGNCGKIITCPFHGWSYNLDGSLRGIALPQFYDNIAKETLSLVPIELDMWHGLIFIRFKPGPQPKIADILAPIENEIAQYPMDKLIPQNQTGEAFQVLPVEANWKSALDVDNEGYHVYKLHPYLNDLYGENYYDIPLKNGLAVSRGEFSQKPKKYWTVDMYIKLCEKHATMVKGRARNQFLYVGIFPNNILQFTPDSVNFYQHIPLSSSKLVQPYCYYLFKEPQSKGERVMSQLNNRIDKYTSREDMDATSWSYEATKSNGYRGICLSNLEAGVHAYHEEMRKLLPILHSPTEPTEY